MEWFDSFFITHHEYADHIVGSYNYTLVAFSIAISAVASFMALHFASMAKIITTKGQRHIAIIAGAFLMAGGVWCMHFVGMMAYDMGMHVTYNIPITLISFVPSLIASYITIRILTNPGLRLKQIVMGSVLVGAGIGLMHYIGMAAMEMDVELQYIPSWFVASIIVAVVLAFVALTVRQYLRRYWPAAPINIIDGLSAVIMGLAISAMHYTGMGGARYLSDTTEMIPHVEGEHLHLSYTVTLIVLLLLMLAGTTASKLRYRQLLLEKTTSELRLKTIMETAVDGIVTIDTDGIIQDFNESAQNIFGWQAEEVIGKSFMMFVPKEAHSEYASYLEDFKNTGKTQLTGQAREVLALHRNGNTFPIRLGVGHVYQKSFGSLFVGFITDISERWAMEDKLRKSEEQFSSLIKNIPGATFRCLIDEYWTAIFVSDAVEDLNGWAPEDFYNKRIHFADLIHPDDVEKANQAVAKALEDKSSYTLEFRMQHRDGHYVNVLENGTIMEDSHGELWIDGLILDISERVEMEENLRSAKVIAEQSAESKARFLANMSHEIRTPMNAIIGFTDILIDADDLAGENQKHLKTISQSARSLMHLLNDVLDSAKLEKDKVELEETPFDLTRLVDSVISTLWLQAKNKGLYLNFEMQPAIHTAYIGDENRLRQVLLNILGNAIKFTEKGGVTLLVSVTTDKKIRFEIQDTGIGMNKSTLEKVFEPFSQADASMNRRFGGTGLGTTISKQLVELMGGELKATSEVNVGSVFFFEILLQQTRALPESSAENGLFALPVLKVLIADDIPQNLTLLSLLLKRQKHEVYQAENGEQAIAKFKELRPDIVLMDLQMPVMDGFTAAKMIREFEHENDLTETPVIALTASVLSDDRVEAKDAGMNGFANKPIDLKALTAEMARVLGLLDDNTVASIDSDNKSANELSQIDVEQGTSLWGDKATYIKEIQRFISEHENVGEKLDKQFAEEKYEELGRFTHNLKGLTGNLALRKLYYFFTALEQHLIEKNMAASEQVIVDIKAAINVLIDELASIGDLALADTSEDRAKLTIEESMAMVNKLISLSEMGELDETMVDNLVGGITSDLHSLAVEVKNAIINFDFAAAKQHLVALQHELTRL
ncbi:PAS domain S-box protein [Methylophaga sp. OBS3]|uniref:PAS domain S-box protein n=1 Tax=Methylophaga sp. OBS3 TaxID=2991934 RepID=UPI002251B2E0|nr:PAS domain S-box protein [Methylophaga sp. OBS3]MCX4188988.1 PAS domain S-box protein [Methylophaga sp. OBS3]